MGDVLSPSERSDLLAAATEAARRAWVPYSSFPVGAALLATDGRVFTGCNVENASFGLTICAERTACVTAVAAGCTTFTAIAIHVDSDDGQPCGACRQFLAEFGTDIEVIYRSGGDVVTSTVGGLLPDSFVPAALP